MSEGTPRIYVQIPPRGLLVIGAAILLGWALISVTSALIAVFISLFLTLMLDPAVGWVMRRTRLGRGMASLVVVGALVLGGFLLTLVLLIPLLRDLQDFIRDLPQTVAELRASSLFQSLDQHVDFGAEAQDHASELASAVPVSLASFVGIGSSIFYFCFILVEITFLTLFLLSDLPSLTGAFRSVLEPETSNRFAFLQGEISHLISRYAFGAIAIATICGTTMGVSAALLGAPAPLALGLISGLLDLIPQVGATIAGIIVCLATLTQGVGPMLIMLAIVLVYQQFENYVLQPAIQGKATNISGFLVIASVVVFGALLGVLGALIAVPVTASTQIVVRELTKERRARIAAMTAAAGAGGEADPRLTPTG
jgi:predicted PurR-regulated permease PerM